MFEMFVAMRYLGSRRKQVLVSVITAIAVAAVAFGVAAMVVVIGVMTGLREDIQSRILAGTAHLNVVRTDGLPIRGHRDLAERLGKLPRITSVAPTVYETVLLQGSHSVAGAILKGVEPADPAGRSEVARIVVEGSADALEARTSGPGGELDGLIVGRDLAKETGLELGDVATIISPEGDPTEAGFEPRFSDFRVVGIFESGLYDYDSKWAYVSLDALRHLTGEREVVQVIQMQVDDIHAVKEIGAAVRAVVGPGYTTRDWQELNEPLYAALSLERLGFYVILIVVVSIAALNIITLLTMMVMEKTADIGTLKAMGATDGTVLRIFMWQGALIGLIGAALGVALGVTLAWYLDNYQVISLPPDVYSISHVSFRLHRLDVAAVAFSTVLISLLSTVVPARAAARLDPVEALRTE
jgi:lipoprotein-releasing system permease protein